jgi:drug/metabolite transporter (DMT)-like permease
MTEPSPGLQHRNLAGIAFILVGVGFMATMDAVAKWLVNAEYPVVQIMALRGWMLTAMLLAIVFRRHGLAGLKTERPRGQALRMLAGFTAPMLFFTALRDLPLADATALFFGSTFFMTALSVPVFGERVGLHRWSAVVVGFVGVLIVTRPGTGTFQVASLLVVGSSLAYACMVLLGRWLGRTEPIFRIVFYNNLGAAVLGSLALPFVWTAMPLADVLVLFTMAVLALGGHFCLTNAFVLAPVPVVAPFEYSALVWATLIGFVVWGDVPELPVVLGGAVIVASGLYVLHRETRGARTPAPAPLKDRP